MNPQKQIGIIIYGAGNIFSLCATLDRLQISYGMIYTAEDFDLYEKIIIPGVGHARKAMQMLENSGLITPIKNSNKWTLGICVGMQLMTAHSEEGNAGLLHLFPLNTRKFPAHPNAKIPHMGWNTVIHDETGIFTNIPPKAYFYFVHSYFIEFNPNFNIAQCDYVLPFSAAISHNRYIGVQFHPEKSGKNGEQLLKNFIHLK